MTTPPRLAVRWLERRLNPDERQDLVGDLTEQFHARVARHGRRAAARWFWRESLALAWGFSWRRRDVVSAAHERVRVRWFLSNAAMDWRHAWRALRASRGSAISAMLTLTVTLGLATSLFSVTNGLLLRPLPYPAPDRLVRLTEAEIDRSPYATSFAPVMPESGGRLSDVAIGLFASATTITHLTPYSLVGRAVTTAAGTEQRVCAEVGVGFFELLGLQPERGRLFIAADAGADAAPTVVLSETFWRDVLESRDDIVGTTLVIDQVPHMIAGVADGSPRFPEADIDLWIAGRWRWPSPGARRNFSTWLPAIARLAPGATVEDASQEARQVGAMIAAATPGLADGTDVAVPVFRIRPLQDDLAQPVRPALVALGAAMSLVLIVAAVSLVNLLLARSTARHREMAVRLTLGAGRWRITRPLLFEQILIAGAGGLGGSLLALWILRVMPAFAPGDLSGLADVRFDTASFLFVSAVALTLGIGVGLLPAWQLPAGSLRDLSPAGRAMIGRRVVSAEAARRALVTVQVALAVVLLVGAGLLARTMWTLSRVDPGFEGEHAVTVKIGLPELIFREPERQSGFFDQVLTRLAQHPDVIAAGASSTLPLNPVGMSGSFTIEGRPRPATPEEFPRANKVAVTAGYLQAVGTPILEGRGFSDEDTAAAERVAIIDESLARRYFPGEQPIGQRIEYLREMRRIVGIARAIKQRGLTEQDDPVIYFPSAQMPAVMAFNRLTGGIAVRTSGDPLAVVPFIRTAVREADATVPVHAVASLGDRLRDTYSSQRFYALILGMFAVLAVVVSVLGVYGVLAYAVERRQAEFGLRRALGGDERHILGLVLRQVAVLIAVGAVAGSIIAGLGAGLLRSLLFGVDALDPATFSAAVTLVACVGLLAASVPAWRAMRVDPARTLRAD